MTRTGEQEIGAVFGRVGMYAIIIFKTCTKETLYQPDFYSMCLKDKVR